MAGWPVGRLAGWPDGRVAGWLDARVAGWPGGRVAGWPGGRMAGCRMAGWPDGRVAGFRQSLITAIFQQSFAQSFKTGIKSAMFPRGFRKVSARFGCWNVQFASMLSSYFATNFPIRKTRRGPNREVAGNFAEDFKAQRYAPSGLPMVFPTTYPAKAICLAKEVKMSLRTKLPQSSSVTRKHAPVPAKIPTRDCCQARPLTRRLTAEHGSADPEQEGRMFENRRLELLFNLLLRNVCGLKGKRFTPKLQLIHELNKRVALRQHSLEVAHYWLS